MDIKKRANVMTYTILVVTEDDASNTAEQTRVKVVLSYKPSGVTLYSETQDVDGRPYWTPEPIHDSSPLLRGLLEDLGRFNDAYPSK